MHTMELSTDRFSRDAFVIDQPFTMFVNRYRIHAPDPDGGPGELLAFCEQKRFAWKEDLRFFEDESRTREVLRIKARRAIDIGGRYEITDADGTGIGALERRAKRSLIRTTWAILGSDGEELAVVQERSVAVAVIRRVQNILQLVPIIGGLIALVTDLIPIPYQFDLLTGSTLAGTQTRRFGFRDRYLLDLSGDPDRRVDRRLTVALGVALDALQSR
jgi:hypothetical protein